MRPSSTSRFIALSIVAAAILTFFWPLVTVDPPVAGTARWSAFSIVLQMYKGALPPPVCERCGEPWVRTLMALPLMVTVYYVLMVVSAAILCLRGPARVTTWIASVGAYICVGGEWRVGTRLEFEATFFGLSRGGQVHYGGLLAAHLVVMGTLFLASLGLRDEESSEEAQERRQSSRLLGEPHEPPAIPEPPFIDAETVSENEKAHETTHDPPRLHD